MKIINIIRSRLQKQDTAYFPRWHLVLAGVLGISVIALLNIPSETALPPESETASLEERPSTAPLSADELLSPLTPLIPRSNPVSFYEFDTSQAAATDAEAQDPSVITEVVRKGDNLSSLFQRAGLTNKHLAEVLDTCKESKNLTQMHPGHRLTFKVDPAGKLERLDYSPNLLETQTYTRQGAGFAYSQTLRKPDVHTKLVEAQISSSLYGAAKSAQISDAMVYELANIFAYDIDFAMDLRRGDSFKILYEEAFLDGKKVRNGQILAAEFTNTGTTYKAVRYLDKDGKAQYYSPDGRALRKGFLRTPVEFARISSGFSLGRKHPILNKIRAHKGVDYSAPTGTPIMASGDGKISLAGTYSGYGNCVIIEHDSKYTTLYGHMSRFASGIRKGSSVKQGQIIGYVGATGLATGPHLHYEFHIGNKVVNPVTVELPKAQAIAKVEMPRFMAQTQPLVAQLRGAANAPVVSNQPAESDAAVKNAL
jgi:murein DD-endopeptidase MepM/ murein hydrolase activator NlpD